jgi:hypothetical protein
VTAWVEGTLILATEDPTQAITERKSALIMAGGRIRLDDVTVELLGGTGAWINVDVVDRAVTFATIDPSTRSHRSCS